MQFALSTSPLLCTGTRALTGRVWFIWMGTTSNGLCAAPGENRIWTRKRRGSLRGSLRQEGGGGAGINGQGKGITYAGREGVEASPCPVWLTKATKPMTLPLTPTRPQHSRFVLKHAEHPVRHVVKLARRGQHLLPLAGKHGAQRLPVAPCAAGVGVKGGVVLLLWLKQALVLYRHTCRPQLARGAHGNRRWKRRDILFKMLFFR